MARSQVLVASIAAIASINLLSSSFTRADDDAVDSSMSQFQFSGLINADNVYVRSGASENDYPVLKLSKGDTVVVVGAKGDWLKILPPDGVFCVVGKVWVEKRGDGSIGRVRDGSTNANVRVGSNLNDMKAKVVTQVKPGDDVKILGDLDEYFKIAPPPGAFVYVAKKFVDVVKRVEVVNNNGAIEVKQADASATATATPNTPTANASSSSTTPPSATPPGTTAPANATANASATASATETPVPTTEPAQAANTASANTAAPTTAPATTAVTSAADFDALEAKFNAASKLPLDQQPVDELIAGYKKVVDEKSLPGSMLKIADYRLAGLQLRKDALTQLQETRQAAAALAAKQVPLQAEAAEIQQRMQQNQLKSFTAVGVLSSSSIYYNGKPLYRLTDPATGRTVVYIATTDPKIIGMEGTFIGVHGQVTDDTLRQIKFISPTSADAVDPADVTSGRVYGGMTPASVAPKGS
ncbi:MAG: SH3 domain-containing protein [Tepidisphaeraceae bacterium]